MCRFVEGCNQEMTMSAEELRMTAIIVGVVHGLLSIVISVSYGTILHIIRKKETRFSGFAYRVIFHLGVADLLTLGGFACSIPFNFIGSTINPTLNKFCGSFAGSFIISVTSLTLVLALDRFTLICLGINLNDTTGFKLLPCGSLTHKSFSRIQLSTILLLASWLCGLGYFIPLLMPCCEFSYGMQNLAWSFVDNPASVLMDRTQLYVMASELSVAGIMYAAVVVKLFIISSMRNSKKISPFSAHTTLHEVRVFVQALIITLFTALCVFLWYQEITEYAMWLNYYVIHTLSTMLCGINPLLYLTFNRRIREEFVRSITCGRMQKENRVVDVNTIAHPQRQNSSVLLPGNEPSSISRQPYIR